MSYNTKLKFPSYQQTKDGPALFASRLLCYVWMFDGDPGALVMKRVIGEEKVGALLLNSYVITEKEFRVGAEAKLEECLDYLIKMAE